MENSKIVYQHSSIFPIASPHLFWLVGGLFIALKLRTSRYQIIGLKTRARDPEYGATEHSPQVMLSTRSNPTVAALQRLFSWLRKWALDSTSGPMRTSVLSCPGTTLRVILAPNWALSLPLDHPTGLSPVLRTESWAWVLCSYFGHNF